MIDANMDLDLGSMYVISAIEMLSPSRAGFCAPSLQDIKRAEQLIELSDDYLEVAEPQIKILSTKFDADSVDFSDVNLETIETLRTGLKIAQLGNIEQVKFDIKEASKKWAVTHRAIIEDRAARILNVLSSMQWLIDGLLEAIEQKFGDNVHYDLAELSESLNSEELEVPDNLDFKNFMKFMNT